MTRRSWRDRRFDPPSWLDRAAAPLVGVGLGAVLGVVLQPFVSVVSGAAGGWPLVDLPVVVVLLCHRGGSVLLGAAVGGGLMAWIAKEEG